MDEERNAWRRKAKLMKEREVQRCRVSYRDERREALHAE